MEIWRSRKKNYLDPSQIVDKALLWYLTISQCNLIELNNPNPVLNKKIGGLAKWLIKNVISVLNLETPICQCFFKQNYFGL